MGLGNMQMKDYVDEVKEYADEVKYYVDEVKEQYIM